MSNDSIKEQKIPFPPGLSKNIVTEKHLQLLLESDLVNSKDIEHFFNSENKNFEITLLPSNNKFKFSTKDLPFSFTESEIIDQIILNF